MTPRRLAAYAAALAPVVTGLCAGGARLEIELRAPADRISPAVILRLVAKEYAPDEDPAFPVAELAGASGLELEGRAP